jgi:ABC-type antimicrobial peptide transport system permease subunit
VVEFRFTQQLGFLFILVVIMATATFIGVAVPMWRAANIDPVEAVRID